jgi:hypothetical protein
MPLVVNGREGGPNFQRDVLSSLSLSLNFFSPLLHYLSCFHSYFAAYLQLFPLSLSPFMYLQYIHVLFSLFLTLYHNSLILRCTYMLSLLQNWRSFVTKMVAIRHFKTQKIAEKMSEKVRCFFFLFRWQLIFSNH